MIDYSTQLRGLDFTIMSLGMTFIDGAMAAARVF